MALSDKEILVAMYEGDIVIEPFERKNLNTSSYDVRLGEWFFREQEPEPIGFRGVYNPWNEGDVRAVWGIAERAQLASEIFDKKDFAKEGLYPDDRVFIIRPGETALAHTEEFIGGRHRITTKMQARSSLGRNFIEVCKCAGWGDVGFFNRWTMELTNNSCHYSIPLVVGRRIGQIVFFRTGEIEGADYAVSGKYQSSTDIKKLRQDWTPELMIPRLWQDREVKR